MRWLYVIINDYVIFRLFSLSGGLAAVIYTDALQTIILVTGAVILSVLGMSSYRNIMTPVNDVDYSGHCVFSFGPV